MPVHSSCDLPPAISHLPSAIRHLPFAIERRHAGMPNKVGVAFFGEGLVVAVAGVAVVGDAAILDGGFDLQACTEPVACTELVEVK